MKNIFYQIIYYPSFNHILRNVIKFLAPNIPSRYHLPPSGILNVPLKSGKLLKLKTNQTNYLTRLIFWEGYQTYEYTTIFEKLIPKVEVFYDIGSSIGYYSLLGSISNKRLKVTAFEIAAGPLHYLRENVRINQLNSINVIPVALSDHKGEITFYEIKNDKYSYLDYNLGGEGNTGSKTTGRNFVSHLVKTLTLDQYVEQNETDSIDLIKMDTEGTEHTILKHAEKVLQEMKPIVICETLFQTIEAELEEVFLRYGYEFYNHVGDYLEKVETIIRQKDDGVRNCFFVHPDRYDLVKEFVRS